MDTCYTNLAISTKGINCMNMTERFLLPDDVTLSEASTLPDHLRRKLFVSNGDYVITRPYTRTPSSIISSQLASFLERFRQPQTIVHAVIAHAQQHQLDPERTLVDLVPALERAIRARWLVHPESADASLLAPRYRTEDRIGEYSVVRCLQSLHDTDVYQAVDAAGTFVAIKVLRPEADADSQRVFRNEIRALQRIRHPHCVHLLDYHLDAQGAYMVLNWCEGRPLSQVADEMRRAGLPRARLLKLVIEVLKVYSSLHAQGWLHGDVHLNNVLVDRHGTVMLVDFGYARLLEDDSTTPPMRGGSPMFYDPQHAATKRFHQPAPLDSAESEQYSLSVIAYCILAGKHYLNFSIDGDEMLRQIVEDAPLSFAEQQVRAWPEVEIILQRALQKQPDQRYDSVATLTAALHTVLAEHMLDAERPQTSHGPQALFKQFLLKVDINGLWLRAGLPTTPLCGVSQGAAGVAYALYRLACLRRDAHLLSLAGLWSKWAIIQSTEPEAFIAPARGATTEIVGPISLYLTATGMYVVQALISHAQGNLEALQQAITGFVSATKETCSNPDVFLGRSGLLLGCALLYDALRGHPVINTEPIVAIARRELHDIWEHIAAYPPIQEASAFAELPMAHGWAGLLYATIRWCVLDTTSLPSTIEERLQQLAACGQSQGDGIGWLVTLNPESPSYSPAKYEANWCNGSAGMVFLWTLADAVFQRPQYHQLAVQAAQHVWANPTNNATVCCGAAGQAYSLLNLYRHSGKGVWLQRAVERMQHALRNVATVPLSPTSLYQGEIGIMLAGMEFQQPDQARLPFFEEEGWTLPPSS
jgi:eukaryotic-like serine/threonine-protein kinase